MNLKQAAEAGVRRIRDPKWASATDYVLIDIIDGQVGPWAKLYSRKTQEAIREACPQQFLSFGLADDGGVEEYTGPLDIADPDFKAKI